MIAYRDKGSRPPFFFLHGDWTGGGFHCGRLAQHLGEEQPFYALPPSRFEKQAALTVEEMAANHLAAIQEHSPHGPYVIGGYCIGATVAVEIARQLVAKGEKVLHLLLIDPTLLKSPVLRGIWPVIDRTGGFMKWDLKKRIHYFDRFGVPVGRWLGRTTRNKFRVFAARLGLAGRMGVGPVTMESDHAGHGENGEILDTLNSEVYMLAYRIYRLRPSPSPPPSIFRKKPRLS